MEAFLNFHDTEQFCGFPMSMDQNGILDSQNSFMTMVDNDFNFADNQIDSELWDTEQELNGDMAVLPEAGVASIIPTMENIKEDFAKVLTDWHEHLGYLQASDFEEGIDMEHLSITSPDKLYLDLPDNIFEEDFLKSNSTSPVKKFCSPQKSSLTLYHTSELEQNDIDVIGVDTVKENKINSDMTHAKEQKYTPTKDSNSKNNRRSIKIRIKKENGKSVACIVEPELDLETAPNQTEKEEKCKKRRRVNDENALQLTSEKKQKRSKNVESVWSSTIVKEEPQDSKDTVLEAGDLASLLEKFEATEAAASDATFLQKERDVKPSVINKKSPEKPVQTQDSKLHKNIKDALPKEVIDRIKESGRKKTAISLIPAMPNKKFKTRGSRTQNAESKTRKNVLKKESIVSQDTANNKISNNGKMQKINGSVQLDHDYCSNSSPIPCTTDHSEYDMQSTDSDRIGLTSEESSRQSDYANLFTKDTETAASTKCDDASKWADAGSKKDSGLESGEISDASEDANHSIKTGKQLTEVPHVKAEISQTVNPTKISNCKAPLYEMKIRSALATSIIRLRNGMLTKAKSVEGTKMVSVLKKPPQIVPVSNSDQNATIPNEINSAMISNSIDKLTEEVNPVEKVIPNASNSNEEQKLEDEQEKKPRKKLKLEEYRNRRMQHTQVENRKTYMIYANHVNTSTEPHWIVNGQLSWHEREIIPVFKSKVEVDEEKTRPKPETCEFIMQVDEQIIQQSFLEAKSADERINAGTIKQEEEEIIIIDDDDVEVQEQHNYWKRRVSCSRSRSRSRSRDRRQNRSRSRGRRTSRSLSKSRSKSRSGSRNRSTSRRKDSHRNRRLSRRRSSVSSNSSGSSVSRSRTRCSYSSRSSCSRSGSKTYRSRSSSRSSRYSSSSRSYNSNYRRSRWSGFGSRDSRDHKWHGRNSSTSRHTYRDEEWRRSTVSLYRRHYDDRFDQEKQKQVEERRVIYVGRLENGITKRDLRDRFGKFGPVADISIHFRDHGDNYGFVTFEYKEDAYAAVEHGNDNPNLPRYDLCFGGRRAFCQVKYADLDGMVSNESLNECDRLLAPEGNTFDRLLQQAQATLRKRKA